MQVFNVSCTSNDLKGASDPVEHFLEGNFKLQFL